MKLATVHLIHPDQMGSFYFTKEAGALALRNLAEGNYTQVPCEIFEDFTGEDAAEEIFDLTNNPYRQSARVAKYGRGRSVSVGDIVQVDGDRWLCRPTGWIQV